jgi:hypothetical protein
LIIEVEMSIGKALAKSGSFGFAEGSALCVGQNQMCHLCGWLKLFLKNVRWGKIKIQKRWLLGRLSDGSFVPLLYVLLCRSFYALSSFRLAGNGSVACAVANSKVRCLD